MFTKDNIPVLQKEKIMQNYNFYQQTYNKKYLPYLINEQEKITNFLLIFFKLFDLMIHSFNITKDQKGNAFFTIKYICVKKVTKKKGRTPKLCFSSLEKALCTGLHLLSNKKPLCVLLYEITTKSKKMSGLPNLFKKSKLFTLPELIKTIQIIKSSKGFAFYVASIICEKMEDLRSKTDKKLQGRLIIFVEKILYFLKSNSHLNISGIRIQIKGRINGIARSKKTIISFGCLTLQQVDTRVDFFYKQVLTVFGSFGIKVWVKYE